MGGAGEGGGEGGRVAEIGWGAVRCGGVCLLSSAEGSCLMSICTNGRRRSEWKDDCLWRVKKNGPVSASSYVEWLI